MTARDMSESQALEDTDPINLFHCPRCGTSQTFLSLEALNSHIESIHICSLPSKVKRSEEGQVDHTLLPILNMLSKESELLVAELRLQKQRKNSEESTNKKHESPDQSTAPSTGHEGLLPVTSSMKDHLSKVPPAGLRCCTSDFILGGDRALGRSKEHLRFSSGSLLCPYGATPWSRMPHVHTSHSNDTTVQQILSVKQKDSEIEKQEIEKQVLTDDLYRARTELDALRSRAADAVENRQREIDTLSETVKLKDMQIETIRENLERATLDKRTVQQQLGTATEQNIAHLETITQLQNASSEKDKMIESKNEELNSLTVFLKSSAEKETFAREKLQEMLNGLLTQKESLEMNLIAMTKQKDMYRCILGNMSGTPLELPDNNRSGGDAGGLSLPNPVTVSCGPEVPWLLSSPGEFQQLPTVAPQVSNDMGSIQHDSVETMPGFQWKATSEQQPYEGRQGPETRDIGGSVQSDWQGVPLATDSTELRPLPLLTCSNISKNHSLFRQSASHRVSFNLNGDDQAPISGRTGPDGHRGWTHSTGHSGVGPFFPLDTDHMSRDHKFRDHPLTDHASRDHESINQPSYQQLQQQVLCLEQQQQQLLATNQQLHTLQLQHGPGGNTLGNDDDDSEVSGSVDSSSSVSSSVVTIVRGHQGASSRSRPELARYHRQAPQVAMTTAKKSPKRVSRVSMAERRQQQRDVIFCVFTYLDTMTLCRASRVSRLWRDMSHHPRLWRSVTLKGVTISSQHINSISRWCTELRSLTLEGLRPRARRPGEMDEEYTANIRGSLEAGLEALFSAAGHSLLSLKVVNCDSVITARCMWLVSCQCCHLERVAYTSKVDPISSEAVWALGAGCRRIMTFIIPPAPRHHICSLGVQVPTQQSLGLNNRGLLMIGRCWPQLRVLCAGGADVSVKGLVAVARRCRHLEVLELCGVVEVNRRTARHMCAAGLTRLEALDLTCTPVTPDALRHFSDCCERLRTITVTVDLSDHSSHPPSDRTCNMHMLEALKEMEICQSLRCKLRVKTLKSSAYDRLM